MRRAIWFAAIGVGAAPARRRAFLPLTKFLTGSLLSLATLLGGPSRLRAQAPQPAQEAGSDSLREKIVVVWDQVTPIAPGAKIVDVSFTNVHLNIVTPVEMVWALDAGAREIVAVASKPITGTAAAGEVMGKRGTGRLRAPAALYLSTAAPYVLENDGRLDILRSGWQDSLELGTAKGPERDIAVPESGLVYALMGPEVRVYTDPPGKAPLWTIALDPRSLPAVAITVSASGTLFVAGQGALALTAYELNPQGAWKLVRSRTARELATSRPSGIALCPNLLLPLPGREGWVGLDRFLVLSDAGRKSLLSFESKDLATLDVFDVAPEVPNLVPGRIDISNRAQIAVADVASGAAYVLPARVLADLVDKAKIRWRSIDPDSIAPMGHGQ